MVSDKMGEKVLKGGLGAIRLELVRDRGRG